MPDTDARGDRFHGTDDDFDPPADVPVAIDPVGLADAVAQFRELSDTAGNPGTPTPGRSWSTTVWDALAVLSADGTHPTLVDLVAQIDDPMCGPTEALWALRLLTVSGVVAPEGAGEGAQRWHLLATHRPGPGVYEAAELARAAASHYGPDPVSAYHLLNQRLDTLLDVVRQRLTAIERRLPVPGTRARLDQVDTKLDDLRSRLDDLAAKQAEDLGAILARLPLAPTLSATTAAPPPGSWSADIVAIDEPASVDGRWRVTLLLPEGAPAPRTLPLGPMLLVVPEDAPTEADNRPPPATRPDLVIAEATIHVLRTRLHPAAFRGIADSDLAFEIAAAAVKALEGAPTEGPGRGRGPLIPSENWTSTDTDEGAQGEGETGDVYLPTAADYARGHTEGAG